VCIVTNLCVLSQYFRPRKLALLQGEEEEELLLGAAVRLGHASTLRWRRAHQGSRGDAFPESRADGPSGPVS
jgi:hypothetical protein